MKKCLVLLGLLILLPAVTLGSPETPGTTATSPATGHVFGETGRVEFDRWYQVLLADQPSGWMRAQVKRYSTDPRNAPHIESITQLAISLKRGSVSVNIELDSTFTETLDGHPLRATTRQKLGATAVDQEMVFKPDEIVTTTRQGGQEHKEVTPVTAADRDWLPPAAAQRYTEKQLAGGAKEIHFWTLDPSLGPHRIETKTTVTGRENVEVMGKVVPALVATATVSAMPNLGAKVYMDEQGQPLKTTVSLIPGMPMTMIEADEQLAHAGVNPPELMASLLIQPTGTIKEPRRLRSAVYEVKVNSNKSATTQPDIRVDDQAFPRTGTQRVVWGDDRTARVVVNLDEPNNPVADLPTDADRRATTMLNFKDPKVKELVDRALAGQPRDLAPAKKAELLRRFVYHFIDNKDLSVGFATASEVARTAEGDCTEHATLLAALLRGAGVPSRTVSGLLYVDHFLGRQAVFGYHMWTEAWLNGGWVDLDAVLDDDTPFDAAHIALQTSSMADDGMFNDMVKLAPLIGRLSIRVVDTGGARREGK